MHKLKTFAKVISFDDMFNEYLPIDLLINYNPIIQYMIIMEDIVIKILSYF